MMKKCWSASGDGVEYDVLIRVDHETVLQAQSVKLRKVSKFFEENLKEKVDGKYLISIDGIPKESFEVLLDYVETGHLTLYEHNVAEVYYAAHRLEVPFVVEKCLQVRPPAGEASGAPAEAQGSKPKVVLVEEPPLMPAASGAEVQSAKEPKTKSVSRKASLAPQASEQRDEAAKPLPTQSAPTVQSAPPPPPPKQEVSQGPPKPAVPRERNFLDLVLEQFPLLNRHGEGLRGLSLQHMIDFLNEDDLGTCCEIPIFVAALLWLDGDYNSRAPLAADLLSCVRFTRMSTDDVLHCFFPPILQQVVERPAVRKLLLDACCYHCAKLERRAHLFPELAPRGRRKYARGRHKCNIWALPEEKASADDDRNCSPCLNDAYLNRKNPQNPSLDMAHWMLTSVYGLSCMLITRHRFINMHYHHVGTEEQTSKARTRSYGRTRYTVQKLNWDDNVWNQVAFNNRMNSEEYESVIFLLGGLHSGHKERAATGLAMARMYPKKKPGIKRFNILPRPLYHHRAAFLNGSVYIVGGLDIRQMNLGVKRPSHCCFAYGLICGTWARTADLNFGRVFHSLVVSQGKLYAVGGQGVDERILSSVECYDPAVKVWSIVHGHFCCPRMSTGAVLERGALLILAGGVMTNKKVSNAVYVTDEVHAIRLPDMTRSNGKFPRLPTPRLSCEAVALPDGTLVILGGLTFTGGVYYESVGDVLALKPGSNQWSQLPPLPSRRHDFSALAVDKDIFVFGGITDDSREVHSDILVLHWESTQWDVWGHLPGPLVGMQTVLLLGKDILMAENA
ncbi:uncharacterized protein LOC135401448 isoform X2 [Ornithodoros turicata]|uniref:uncharacterized protein LOC135401448 isoform X2 n=1 Tax=Ornithodoros turicata TaxID=34597 RepID=UPI003138B108